MAEEPQTPGHDRLGDRRLGGTDANFLVGNVRGEGNLQNVPKAPLIERIKSLAGLHHTCAVAKLTAARWSAVIRYSCLTLTLAGRSVLVSVRRLQLIVGCRDCQEHSQRHNQRDRVAAAGEGGVGVGYLTATVNELPTGQLKFQLSIINQ